MNFFEKELRGLLGDRPTFMNAKYIGRACITGLSAGVRLKVEFSTTDTHEHYDALKLSVINAKEGTVDKLTVYFSDYLHAVVIGRGPSTTVPYIWSCRMCGYEWYPHKTSTDALKPLADAVCEYAKVFK